MQSLKLIFSLARLSEITVTAMGCEAQLAWKCLFMPTFSAGDVDPQSRSDSSIFWCAIMDH